MAAKESIEVTGDMLSIEVIDEREMQSPFGITDEEMRDLEEYIYDNARKDDYKFW